MIGFPDSFLPWTAATLIPAFLGLLLIVSAERILDAIFSMLKRALNRIKSFFRRTSLKADPGVTPSARHARTPKYLSAFGLGIFLWFFVDTIGGAASLDVVDAFSASWAQIATVGLFVVGLIVFFSVDRNRNVFSPQLSIGKYGLAIPLLVAASVGIHGLGEGAAFGALASQTTSTALLDAFAGPSGGGLNAAVAYVLHKALEPMMIGACYCAYAKDHGRRPAGYLRDLLLLSITFAIPIAYRCRQWLLPGLQHQLFLRPRNRNVNLRCRKARWTIVRQHATRKLQRVDQDSSLARARPASNLLRGPVSRRLSRKFLNKRFHPAGKLGDSLVLLISGLAGTISSYRTFVSPCLYYKKLNASQLSLLLECASH